MVEVEGGGKHGDEFELQFKTGVAAIERVGWVGFEGRRGGLSVRMVRWFIIQGRIGHDDGLTAYEDFFAVA